MSRVKYLIFRNAPCILAQFTIQQFHCFTPDCTTTAVQQLLYDIEKYWGRQEKVNLEKKGSFHGEKQEITPQLKSDQNWFSSIWSRL